VTGDVLGIVERYYDAAPRSTASAEAVGPFTLFVKNHPTGWDFYARPRLGLDVPFTAADVEQVRDRQRELGVPEALEWVHEVSPTLLAAARADGLHVEECPLLALADPSVVGQQMRRVEREVTGRRVAILSPDSADLPRVLGAVDAGFSETDEVLPRRTAFRVEQMRAGLVVVAGAYDERGDVVGGGSHSPRDGTTELTGIAVLPKARRRGVGAAVTSALVADARERDIETVFLSAQDEAVARVYHRVGFVRIGTACIAEPPAVP
jgi:ribosomal protein S18 acetylase RimI-like enzyme